MSKRLSRWYFKNEKKVLEKLGLNPQPGSGSGELFKEDGENENLLAQLKTTETKSIKITMKDFIALEDNALVCHKTPVFINQVISKKRNDIFITCKVEDLMIIAKNLNNDLYVDKPIPDGFEDFLEGGD